MTVWASTVGASIVGAPTVAASGGGRDRAVDLVRVLAVAAVVVGHWSNAHLVLRDGQLVLDYVVLLVPSVSPVTLLLQVMPLVFVVGGYANAAAWRSARAAGMAPTAWSRTRARRLLDPAAALVSCWVLGGALLVLGGLDVGQVLALARNALGVLWFLAVYAPMSAVTPWTTRLQERLGGRAVVGLAVLAIAADAAGRAGVPLVAWTNVAWVWLAFHQLGHWWQARGTVAPGPACALLLGGAATVAVLVGTGVAPVSMIDRANSTPPSTALLALGVAHAGAVLLLHAPLRRMAERPSLWRILAPANALAGLAYLWHVTALTLVGLVLVRPGAWPDPPVASAAWWALRLPWLLPLVATTAVLVTLAARAHRPGTAP